MREDSNNSSDVIVHLVRVMRDHLRLNTSSDLCLSTDERRNDKQIDKSSTKLHNLAKDALVIAQYRVTEDRD